MIGIYKITNKTNGKSYVGQSIHCGKRLDEHCKGAQLIDEIIQIEGIENFTFEILKEVNRENLSYWEDYYIIKYDTMFPNGYNKKWNCNEETRERIKWELGNRVSQKETKGNITEIIMPTEEKYIGYNSMKLYVYLNELKDKNNLFKQKDLILSRLYREIGITDKTVKSYIYSLEETGLIKYNGEHKFIFSNKTEQTDQENKTDKQNMIQSTWKIRNKEEKNQTYSINYIQSGISIPRETLKELVYNLKVTEMTLDIYLILYFWKRQYQQDYFTYENVRDILNLKLDSRTNNNIHQSLCLLNDLNLIKFSMEYTYNQKMAKIPLFKIEEVNCYIDKPVNN